MKSRRLSCLWAVAFFGLTPEDKEIILEPIFLLMYYMGFSYKECMNLPIWQRKWFIERINTEFKRAKEANSDSSRAAHQNTPDMRALQGMARPQVPSKLRRFT